jgi:Leucine-rich repeat (LRR) protein
MADLSDIKWRVQDDGTAKVNFSDKGLNDTRATVLISRLMDAGCKIGGHEITGFDFSDNELTEIPRDLCNHFKTTFLHFGNNSIKEIGTNIISLRDSLEFLELSGNRITQLPQGFHLFTKLNGYD